MVLNRVPLPLGYRRSARNEKASATLDSPRPRVVYQFFNARGLGGPSSQQRKQTVIDRELHHACSYSLIESIQHVSVNASRRLRGAVVLVWARRVHG